MSEKVELARRGFDAFSRGDFDAALQEMHPEVEWHLAFRIPDLPIDGEVGHGKDEVLAIWNAFTGGWDSLRIEVEDVIRDEGDILVLRTRFVGHGSVSGIEVDRAVYYVLVIRDGLLRRVQPFLSEAEALAAADPDG